MSVENINTCSISRGLVSDETGLYSQKQQAAAIRIQNAWLRCCRLKFLIGGPEPLRKWLQQYSSEFAAHAI